MRGGALARREGDARAEEGRFEGVPCEREDEGLEGYCGDEAHEAGLDHGEVELGGEEERRRRVGEPSGLALACDATPVRRAPTARRGDTGDRRLAVLGADRAGVDPFRVGGERDDLEGWRRGWRHGRLHLLESFEERLCLR